MGGLDTNCDGDNGDSNSNGNGNGSDYLMIRTGPLEIADYNVANVELSPEDLDNPELLVLSARQVAFHT